MAVGKNDLLLSFLNPLSLLQCLKRGHKKRLVKQKKQRVLQQLTSVEHLEDRTLLSGTSLISITPNSGDELYDGMVLNESPTEFVFKFDPGKELDPASLGGIQIERGPSYSITVEPTYVGIGETPNEVIMRFGETLPEDIYQITVFGSNANPLMSYESSDVAAEKFLDGFDTKLSFELDLAPKIASVVPQPVTRTGGSLEQALDKIEIYFEGEIDETSAVNPDFYQLINTTNNSIESPQAGAGGVVYDQASNKVTLTFAANLSEGTYHLRIGESVDPNFTAATEVSILDDDNSSFSTVSNVSSESNLGTLGTQTLHITQSIEKQNVTYTGPDGSQQEPGHRNSVDSHFLNEDTYGNPEGEINTVQFYFPDTYTDHLGNLRTNQITKAQKQRVREIYELFASVSGLEAQEIVDPQSAESNATKIITGDVRAVSANLPTSVSGGSLRDLVVVNGGLDWGDSEYGGEWFKTALHEIGHSLGLGDANDLPSMMNSDGSGAAQINESIYLTDHDIVHLNYLYPVQSSDIDLYKFTLDQSGKFNAEIIAERITNDPLLKSQLDSVLSLYNANHELIARNDNYFGKDSFLELDLEAGDYYLAVTSVGNTNFNPAVSDSGTGGKTDGQYELNLSFKRDTLPSEHLVDASGLQLDGDADGAPGGVFNFWFEVGETIFVDKVSGEVTEDGSLATPYKTIEAAIDAVTLDGSTAKIIRIVGNGGVGDSQAYEIGFDDHFQALTDGLTFEVPTGVTVMIDAGTIIKLQNANIDVGSNSLFDSRSGGALQILGTPENQVYLTSFANDAVGLDSNSTPDTPTAGDWGGIVFRADSDREENGIFLNSINNANISYGGGRVFVNTAFEDFAPIQVESARPAIWNSSITHSANVAISADLQSFEDSRFVNGSFTLDRHGLEVRNNTITDNSVNGLFVQIDTPLGGEIDKLDLPAIFDDDITHLITENLHIAGAPAGQLIDGVASVNGRLKIAAGTVIKLDGARIEAERGNSQIIAEGTAENPILFTSWNDDRYGEGTTFDTTNDGYHDHFNPGSWGGIIFNASSSGSIDHALVTNAGGNTPLENGFAQFNPIEVHQADLRLTNSIFENNSGGFDTDEQNNFDDRNGRGINESATIFVRDSQSIIVNNTFRNNTGTVLSIDVNSLNSEFHEDYGTTTGTLDAFNTFSDNQGALVRLNRMENNGLNGMKVRGGVLTTESVWDDTDIVHVLQDEVLIDQHHTFSGLRLKSSRDASLIVKLAGDDAGFTATGIPLDSEDRIGGTVQIIGQPEYPVILTSLNDDTIGASLTPQGILQTDTNNNGASTPSAGDWRSIRLDSLSNDRNVVVRFEEESTYTDGEDLNKNPFYAQKLGILAPDQLSGDENQVLGFEVHGSISADTSEADVDVYSFQAMGGTEVWIDIDRTSSSLNTVVELVDIFGRSLVLSDDSATEISPVNSPRINADDTGILKQTDHLGEDFYSQNKGDAGFWVRLPDPGNNELGTYFIRVKSQVENGETTSGQYQLQIRLRQTDEKPGSTVRYADIRYATNGIEIIGLPTNSPLLTDAAEKSGDNNTFENSQNLGNLLTHDQGTISVSGSLSSSTDVDWYTFELGYDLIDVVNGLDNAGKSLATIFDIDYADGLSRPDTTISVFDENGTLILISRDSNIEDDQANGDQTDFSSGSFGTYDPYIGAVNLPAGNPGSTFKYHVAISSNSQLPQALNATFTQDAANPLIRLEPVSSIKRIVEDHIGFTGFTSGSPHLDTMGPETVAPENGAIFDISNAQTLDTHVAAFTLSDVKLFISKQDQLLIADPYDGRVLGSSSGPANATIIGALSTNGKGNTQDITIRSDGKLFSYEALDSDEPNEAAGRLNELDPGTGVSLNSSDPGFDDGDKIPDIPESGTKADPVQLTTSKVEALAFQRLGLVTLDGTTTVDYGLYYSVFKDDDTTTLYRANPEDGKSGDERWKSGDNGDDGDSGNGGSTSSEPEYSGNTYTVIGDIVGYDSLGEPINQAQMGRVTGMSFAGVNATIDQAVLYGVTSTGLIVAINHDLVEEDLSLTPTISATVINDLSSQIDGNFTGLTTAPQNLHNGAFKNFLFAITDFGNLYAINPLTGELVTQVDTNPDPNTEELISVFEGGATHINVGVNDVTGLAFSPLDFNLWHPTFKQGDAAGHGINNTYDSNASLGDTTRTDAENVSRSISDLGIDQTEQEGGASFYFGFEEITTDGHFIEYNDGAQYGVHHSNYQTDLATNPDIANTYNFAGGAHGSLVSSTFDLGDHDADDKPTLYFNYYLDTEASNSLSGGMQDAARVFIGYYDEFNVYQWVQVATNNSVTANPLTPNSGELSSFLSASDREGSDSINGAYTNQHVQELFDAQRDENGDLLNATWRQARVDLSDFAGKGELTLRFDFSTAGAITNDQSMPGDEFGNFNGNGQAQNNKYEGFYIDDIIVGFAERGETVTGATSGLTDFTSTPSNPHPNASQDIALGPYQLQIRQATNYAIQPNGNYPGTVIQTQYDTNDRLVPELGLQGDLNPEKQQGQIVIESNTISYSAEDGISVDAGISEDHEMGSFAAPSNNAIYDTGSAIVGFAPGLTIQNNVIYEFDAAGIHITGASNDDENSTPSAVTYTKVVNNTIVGTVSDDSQKGTGILVEDFATTTIINNIVTFTQMGIDIDDDDTSVPSVIGANLFQGNQENGDIGNFPIVLDLSDPLFVSREEENFYLADNSRAIDSSLNSLADRVEFVTVRNSIGMPNSDTVAPTTDRYNDLRVDDPTQTPPPGLGANIFKDRGALERTDVTGPAAELSGPAGSVYESDSTQIVVSDPQSFNQIIINLTDNGTGIDDATVNPSQITVTRQTNSTDSVILVEGVDYYFTYNPGTDQIILTSASGLFQTDAKYTVEITDDGTPISDLAGNALRPNQPHSSDAILFTLYVGNGINQAPMNLLNGTALPDSPNKTVSTDSNVPLVFSATNGNAITISDRDEIPGYNVTGVSDPLDYRVTLTTQSGTLALGSLTGLSDITDTGTSIQFTGTIADINAALDGLTWTADDEYYSSKSGVDTAWIQIATEELNQKAGLVEGDTLKTDTDIIDITVNDPKTISFSSLNFSESEDGGTIEITLTREATAARSYFDLVLSNGTANGAADSSGDYVNTIVQQIEFLENETEVTVSITINDDNIVEADETFTLQLQDRQNETGVDYGNAFVDSQIATATIINDDQALLSIDDVEVNESEGGSQPTTSFVLNYDSVTPDVTLQNSEIAGQSVYGHVVETTKGNFGSNAVHYIYALPDGSNPGALGGIRLMGDPNVTGGTFKLHLGEFFDSPSVTLNWDATPEDIMLALEQLISTESSLSSADIIVNLSQSSPNIEGQTLATSQDSGNPNLNNFINLTIDSNSSISHIRVNSSGLVGGTYWVQGTDIETNEIPTNGISIVEGNQTSGSSSVQTASGFIVRFPDSTAFAAEVSHYATAAQIQAALEAIPGIGVGNVLVEGSFENSGVTSNGIGGGIRIEFTGDLGLMDIPYIEFEPNEPSPAGFQYVSFQAPSGDSGSNEVQTLSLPKFLSGGTFTLTFDGEETIPLAYNATVAEIKSALEALSSIGSGNVLVDGGNINGSEIIVTFVGERSKQDVASLIIDGSGLEFTSPQDVPLSYNDNEWDPISVNYSTASSTFTISYNGSDTAALPITATADEVEQALQAVGAYNVDVMGSFATGNMSVHLLDARAYLNDSPEVPATIDVTISIGNGTVVDQDLEVTYQLVNNSAEKGTDYAATTGKAIILAGSSSATIQIPIHDDDLIEATEDFDVVLLDVTAIDNTGAAITRNAALDDSTATVTIKDDDAAVLSINEQTFNEDAGTVTVTVSIDKALEVDLTANYEFVNGTTSALDYTISETSGTLTIPQGSTSVDLTLTILDDSFVEEIETFDLVLTNIFAGELSINDVNQSTIEIDDTLTGTFAISNNDSASLAIQETNVTHAEGSAGGQTTAYEFIVELTGNVQDGLTLAYQTDDNTATTADNDYVDNDDSISFAGISGETQTITVLVNQDTQVESDEVFDLFLGSLLNVGATTATNITVQSTGATGTITNDDHAIISIGDVVQNEGNSGNTTFTFTISSNRVISEDVTFDFTTVNDTADATDFTAVSGSGTITAGQTSTTIDVIVSGDTTVEPDEQFFIELSNLSANGLQIQLDISQLHSFGINELGVFNTDDFARDVQVVGNLAYVTDDSFGLLVLDISDPANITEVGSFDTPNIAFKLHVLGDVAYIADNDSGLRVLDISDPANISEMGSYDTPGLARGLYVVGNTAYIADGSSGIRLLDISDPANISELGFYNTPGFPENLHVIDDIAYVADGSAGLLVLDISDPANINELGSFDTPGGGMKVEVIGNIAYVADGGADSSLRLLDISDPANISELGFFDTSGSAQDVNVVGNLAYVADFNGGLRVLDISDPANITEIGFLDTSGSASSIQVKGNTAYLADGLTGLLVLGIDAVSRATGTIANEDVSLTLSADQSQAENNPGQLTFTVTLSEALDSEVTVDVNSSDGTATLAGSDYVQVSETLTFAAGETTKTFTVDINDDNIAEADETFALTLSNVVNSSNENVFIDTTNGNDFAEVTITNDDTAIVSIVETDVTLNEGTGGTTTDYTFTVQLSAEVQGGFDLSYTTNDGTATVADGDYVDNDSTVTFVGTLGENQQITVSVNHDNKVEADEVFNLLLGSLSNIEATAADDITLQSTPVTGIITNDDTAIVSIVETEVTQSEGTGGSTTDYTFTVQLSADVQGGFDLSYTTNDGTATTLDGDYVDNDGTLTFVGTASETQNVTVSVNHDNKVEANELFTLLLGSLSNIDATAADDFTVQSTPVTGTITNDDTATLSIADATADEATGQITFTITASDLIQESFTADLATADEASPSALAGTDYTTLNSLNHALDFSSSLSQTVTVSITDETIVELDETFLINMTNMQGTVAGDLSITDGQAIGTITNDDTATISIDDVIVSENASTVTLTVSVSNLVDNNVAVSYATSDDTALNGTDYTLTTGTATVLANSPSTTFTVPITDNGNAEILKRFFVDLSNIQANGMPVVFSDAQAVVTIIDDESTTLSISNHNVDEEFGQITFTVTSSTPLSSPFEVDIATVEGTATSSDFTTKSETLMFAANETSKTFTVDITSDNIAETDESFQVVLSNVTNNILPVFIEGPATGTIVDNDSATLSINDVSTNESTGQITFTITSSSNIEELVTILSTTSYLTASAGDMTALNAVSQDLNFSSGLTQTVTVNITDEAIVEADETFQLNFVIDDDGGADVTILDGTGTGTILNDETATITISDVQGEENSGQLDFTITSSHLIDIPIDVIFETEAFSAVSTPPDPDFVGLPDVPGTLDFTSAFTAQRSVTLVNDTIDEGNETFLLNIKSVETDRATILSGYGTGTILDTDDAAFYVSVAGAPQGTFFHGAGSTALVNIPVNLSKAGSSPIEITYDVTFSREINGIPDLGPTTVTDIPYTFAIGETTGTINITGLLPLVLLSAPDQGLIDYTFTLTGFSGSVNGFTTSPDTTSGSVVLQTAGALIGSASPNTTINTSLVMAPTETDANGEVVAVPESEAWIDEWDSFWVEVWGNTTDGTGISGGTFDLDYNTEYFTATEIEYGTAWGTNSQATIDDQTGIVSGISGSNSLSTLGGTDQVLLARVKFESLADDNVAIDLETGFLGPHDLGLRVMNAELDIVGEESVMPTIQTNPATDLWAVPYDIDDNGEVNFQDLTTFVTTYNSSVLNAGANLAWTFDIDKNTEVDFDDLTYFAANYNKSKARGDQIDFPANFPQEWYGSEVETEGEDTFEEIIDAAVSEWKDKLGNEDLMVQVVVTDLPELQLGGGQILELDENGIPVLGRVYIDEDATGIGWYSSIEGAAFDDNGLALPGSAAEGHYDLYSVLLHEIGHVVGFTSSYSAFYDLVETNEHGEKLFVGSDFVVQLTDDGVHIDEPVDLMNPTFDPSTRKTVSDLDVQILEAVYANALGATIDASAHAMIDSHLHLTAAEPVVEKVAIKQPETEAEVFNASSFYQEVQQPVAAELDDQQEPSILFIRESLVGSIPSSDQDEPDESLIDVIQESSYLASLSEENSEPDALHSPFDFIKEENEYAYEEDYMDEEELNTVFSDWGGPLL